MAKTFLGLGTQALTPSLTGLDLKLRGDTTPVGGWTADANSSDDQLRMNVGAAKVFRRLSPAALADKHRWAGERAMALKVLTGRIAMHLDDAWRSGLFRQLDNMLDAEDWDFSDRLPEETSFRTYLRMVIHLGAVQRPGLGATAEGHIIAAWTQGRDRLTVECMPDDQGRWVLTKYVDGEKVSAAGKGPVRLLQQLLAPYEPDRWWRDSSAAT